MANRLNVVLTTEGTYPYYRGGVSTWADISIKKLDDIDFRILAIMMHPYITINFKLPPNVLELINVPLWGTEEPTEYVSGLRFSEIFNRKLKTHKDIIETVTFIIQNITHAIYYKNPNLPEIGANLVQLYDIFQEYDYRSVFRSKFLWDFFYDTILDFYKDVEEKPSVYEVVESLRWLYRFFISLLSPLREADIYHSSAAAFCGLPCVIAKIKKGSKFLLTEHGVYLREQYLFASREKMPVRTKEFFCGLVSLVSKLNYFFSDQVSPVCAYNKRWEVKLGTPEEKIKVIYNGIDTDLFRKMNVRRDDRPTIVMVARIDHLKDIETYIKTCIKVKEKIPNVLFKLFGPIVEKDYYEWCKNLVTDLNLNGNFVFEGLSFTPEIANNEGDVVILTSISEAFPFAVLEGMACEKVVISSDVGGTSEVLEGHGFIIKPRDYHAFAEKIIYVLEHPSEAAEIGIEARQRVLNGFRIDDMIRKYRETYHSLAGKNAS
jgi:glycosyltransferase involved in cell wall biosynthesis